MARDVALTGRMAAGDAQYRPADAIDSRQGSHAMYNHCGDHARSGAPDDHSSCSDEALLLGRRSYEFFAALWPSRSGELADRLNSLPKYVVSSSLEDPDWNNSRVLKGEVVNDASKLKHELDGEINVIASFQLGRALIEHDLVDELRLMVLPVVLGAGERLFGETSDTKSMRVLDTRAVGGGVAYLTYELVREA
jgi:dihydrofolate reductase